ARGSRPRAQRASAHHRGEGEGHRALEVPLRRFGVAMVRIHPSLQPWLEPIDSVSPHPENPNEGDVEMIARSIEMLGLYAPIVVQESSRFIVKGNHTWAAMLSLGAEKIPVVRVNVTDDQALRIMLADNRIASLATVHDDQAAQLLGRLMELPSSLTGTGYEE